MKNVRSGNFSLLSFLELLNCVVEQSRQESEKKETVSKRCFRIFPLYPFLPQPTKHCAVLEAENPPTDVSQLSKIRIFKASAW